MPLGKTILSDDNKIVTVTTDGSKERLDVDARVSGVINATTEVIRYRPKFYTSKTPIAISDTADTQILNLNFDGQISGISLNYDKSTVETILNVDGTEILRIDHNDLTSSSTYDLMTGPTAGFALEGKNTGKHLFLAYRSFPVDIISNLTIKAKKTTAQTTNLVGVVIVYREKIV